MNARVPFVAIATSAIIACSTTTAVRHEGELSEPRSSAPPPLAVERIEDVGRPASARATQKETDPELAVELDLAVLKFSAEARDIGRDASSRNARARYWPERLRSSWSRVIVFLEDALARSPGDYPSPLLLRTRIALDSELDEAIKTFGRAPETVRDGMKQVRALLSKHLRDPATPKIETQSAAEIVLAWPVPSPTVSSPFGSRNDPIIEEGAVRFHSGVDLAGATGDVVVAAASGRVSFVGWLGGSGNTVVVQHESGYVTLYGHLQDTLVELGARVTTGTPVGFMGSTGRSTGPHLHFEVRRRGVPIDPQTVIHSKLRAGASSTPRARGGASPW